MFIRTSRVTRGDKVYEYPQLVESYRRADGRSTHRVIASLQGWSPEAIETFRIALEAGREGKALVAVERQVEGATASHHQVVCNHDYLALAVFTALWERLRLSIVLDEVLPSESVVAHSKMVLLLVLQRCVAPDSKLAACGWYPTTALPEILGVKPRYVNNSRVHRTLSALCDVEGALQTALAPLVHAETDGVVATFLDLTDTWFVGDGPELSRKGKTKEGLYREKIGIALLCDQRGYPLRWKTVQGCLYEPKVMLEVLGEAAEAGALGGQPVVMDRAMGSRTHLDALTDAGVAYVTALTRNEFKSFVLDGPWKTFDEVAVAGTNSTRESDLARIAKHAHDAGMHPLPDGRFVKDLGVAACVRADARPASPGQGPIAELLREVEIMQRDLRLGSVASKRQLAERYGCSPKTIYGYLRLAGLAPSVRARVLQGEAEAMTLEELIALATDFDQDEQEDSFDELLASLVDQRRSGKPPIILDLKRDRIDVRRVVTFSPQLCLDMRTRAQARLNELLALVASLNQDQATRDNPRRPEDLLADVRVYLQKHSWLDLFETTTKNQRTKEGLRHMLVLTRKDAVWARRRRLDGFGVIVAHPHVRRTAADLVALYFSKDVVEKDFQVIKSQLDLRPVRHRTDPKVRAHVTICILALFIQRVAEHTLRRNADPISGRAMVNALGTCHLNKVQPEHGPDYYTITRPTPRQRELLRALDLGDLVDDEKVRDRIRPR